ncbi:MAG: sugar fermentation stimulation protein [Bdellovibrio sp. ArHS]|uniref:DNA/RNA nuclease SfsA n=1 Tax=Bdellovibrio sp. ArHS TaxID=1569284 RepID=UPI0005830F8F|nr:DNA/RNA nuclease SfsA [Bdellovibrio sp. ArHS]KHD89859.1 MAG: sugar fermentation stimulation protein [Bdellovibrio sp. ArHS]
MKFSQRLHEGVFLKRYKRFFADVQFQGQEVVAHVPNTGSLKSVNNPGQLCLISETDNPERKLKFTLQAIQSPQGSWVGVNTATPNTVMKETLLEVVGKPGVLGTFAHWSVFDEVKPEYKISAETRLDFVLKKKNSEKMHFIEVKNVTLAEATTAKFPDAVSERAQKHLRELMQLIEQGHSAEIVFTVQRPDCDVFAPADDIDPAYGQLLREAHGKGVKVTPLVVKLSPEAVELSEQELPCRF